MQPVSHYERMQIASMLHPAGAPVQVGVAVFLCPEGDASAELYERAAGPSEWWSIPEAAHNDLPCEDLPAFMARLEEFLERAGLASSGRPPSAREAR